jgi:Putative Ig domain
MPTPTLSNTRQAQLQGPISNLSTPSVAQLPAQLWGIEPRNVASRPEASVPASATPRNVASRPEASVPASATALPGKVREAVPNARDASNAGPSATAPAVDLTSPISLTATREAGVSFFYAMPCGSVQGCEPQSKPKLMARAEDGGALPAWLKFDADSATFFGTAPTKTQQVRVRITTLDAAGGKPVLLALNFAGGEALP